jgi:ABC-type antimicrobial peptide transport system permease subunit
VDKSFNYFFQLLLGTMVALGIFNTALLSVLERKREFGVMLAVGLSPGVLFKLVMLESLFMGISGLALGAVLSTPWYLFLKGPGLNLTRFVPGGVEAAGGVMIRPIYHIALMPSHGAVIASVLLLFTLLAGAWPAWKAGRLPPVESIREI